MHEARLWGTQNGVAAVAWGPWGYKMMVAEVGTSGQVLELGLAKSLRASHRIASKRSNASALYTSQEAHLLQVRLAMLCTAQLVLLGPL